MKRYGYTETSVGAGLSKYAELRFCVTLFSGLAIVFSKAMAHEWYGVLYLGYWFVLNILAYLPEIIRKISVYPVILVCALSMSYVLLIDGSIFHFSWREWDESSRYIWVRGENRTAIGIFKIYNFSLIMVCFLYLTIWREKNC